MINKIVNLGDSALYCDFGQEVNKEVNSKVIKYFYSIKKSNIEGLTNLTPSMLLFLTELKYFITFELISLFTSCPKSQYKAESPKFTILLIILIYITSG